MKYLKYGNGVTTPCSWYGRKLTPFASNAFKLCSSSTSSYNDINENLNCRKSKLAK